MTNDTDTADNKREYSHERDDTMGFDVLGRPAPELEFEGWLALYPDALTEDPEPLIEEFCERWEIELDDETRTAMLDTFHRIRREELDGDEQ